MRFGEGLYFRIGTVVSTGEGTARGRTDIRQAFIEKMIFIPLPIDRL